MNDWIALVGYIAVGIATVVAVARLSPNDFGEWMHDNPFVGVGVLMFWPLAWLTAAVHLLVRTAAPKERQ